MPEQLDKLYSPIKKNQDEQINRRVKSGWVAFGKLAFILENKNTLQYLKTNVHDQSGHPVSPYGAEI